MTRLIDFLMGFGYTQPYWGVGYCLMVLRRAFK